MENCDYGPECGCLMIEYGRDHQVEKNEDMIAKFEPKIKFSSWGEPKNFGQAQRRIKFRRFLKRLVPFNSWN